MASKDITKPGFTRRRDGIDGMYCTNSQDTVSSDVGVNKLLSAMEVIQKQDLNVLGKLLLSGEKVYPAQDSSTKWTENVELERKYNLIEAERNDLKNQLKKLLTEKKTHDDELVKVRASLKEAEQESRQQRNEILQLQKLTDSQARESKHERQELADRKEELKSMERKLEQLKRAKDEAEKAKDDAMTRLSRHMGQQMSEGNPNITDLSDQNRPSKLGERYSELYDNEWTNAFEVLTNDFHLDDKIAIKTLQTIVRKAHWFAIRVSPKQILKTGHILSGSSEEVGPECTRLLKEARKHVDIRKADRLFQDFVNEILDKSIREYMKEQVMMLFAKECFQLCWLMSIQDPQVFLAEDPDPGDRFDANLYKHYTISGDEVDYVVWPAVLLHEKGPLLVKGVAQPIPGSKGRAKSAPVAGRFKERTDLTRYEGSVRNMKSAGDKSRQNQGTDYTAGYHESTVEDVYNQSATRTDSRHTTLYRGSASTADTTRQREKPDATFLQQEQTLHDANDKKRFETFCNIYNAESHKRCQRYYDTDFNRYYDLYIKLTYGRESTA